MSDPVTTRCTCGATVADATAHATWHALLAAHVPALAVDVTTTDPGTGQPAPQVLDPTQAGAADVADALRVKTDTARATITDQALPALDSYLANPAPSQGDALAQVRTLTLIVRGLALAVRALIRLAAHRLDSTDDD